MSGERMTEAEWRLREARRECAAYGHDWDFVQTLAGPVAVTCARGCGDPGYNLVRPTAERNVENDALRRAARELRAQAAARFDAYVWDAAAHIDPEDGDALRVTPPGASS